MGVVHFSAQSASRTCTGVTWAAQALGEFPSTRRILGALVVKNQSHFVDLPVVNTVIPIVVVTVINLVAFVPYTTQMLKLAIIKKTPPTARDVILWKNFSATVATIVKAHLGAQ